LAGAAAQAEDPEALRAAGLATALRGDGGFFPDGSLRCAGQFAVAAALAAEQAIGAHPAEAPWHEVAAETLQEDRTREGDVALAPAVAVVLGLEGDAAAFLIDRLDPGVAHGDATGVAGEIADHRPGIAQSRATEDVPVAPAHDDAPLATVLDGFQSGWPAQVAAFVEGFQFPQVDGAEDLGHGADGKEVAIACLFPSTGLAVAPPGGDEHVEVGVPVQGATPGVEHAKETAIDVPVVFLEGFEGLGGGAEEDVGGGAVVEFEEVVEFLRDGEDDVEVGAVGQAFADLFGPLCLPGAEAIGAVAVAAGTGEPVGVAAVLAADAVEAKRALPAEGEEVEGGVGPLIKPAGPEVAPVAKDAVDGGVNAVTVNSNSMKSPPQASFFCYAFPNVLSSAFRPTYRPSTAGMEARIQRRTLPAVGCAGLLCFLLSSAGWDQHPPVGRQVI